MLNARTTIRNSSSDRLASSWLNCVAGRRLAAGELPGQAADLLDQIERGVAFEAADDVAKHAAQEVDLATELVIGAHGCESSFAAASGSVTRRAARTNGLDPCRPRRCL